MSATYDISAIKDFLAVPTEKREAMLIDFLHWMTLCDEVVAKCAPKQLRVGDYFRWIDDGMTGLTEIIIRPVESPE